MIGGRVLRQRSRQLLRAERWLVLDAMEAIRPQMRRGKLSSRRKDILGHGCLPLTLRYIVKNNARRGY